MTSPGGSGFASSPNPSWKIKLLYDGDCPICTKEVDFLRSKDQGRGQISFVDISDPKYDPSENGDVSYEEGMKRIHGVLFDGTVVTGVDVFKVTYDAIGMGWLWTATEFPPIRALADVVYDVWTTLRLPLSGRPALAQVLRDRKTEGIACGDDEDATCEVEFDD